MLSPSDIVSAKLLVQIGDVDPETARATLRELAQDPSAEVDLVARLTRAGALDMEQTKRIRHYVALFEHVRHEAVYLRQLEQRRVVPPEEVGELIAQIEHSSYRRRLGAVLVDGGRLTMDQAVDIERETRRILHEEACNVVERYRQSDYEGVARPLVPCAAVDLSVFRISVLFRSRATQARVSRALLRLRLEAEPAHVPPRQVEVEAQQVFSAVPHEVPDPQGESTTEFDSARFRSKESGGDEDLRQRKQIDHYQVMECLGQGGMGAVYLAAEEGVAGSLYAVKVMHAERADAVDLARFDREAHVCSLLQHPNVVHLIERGRTEDDLDYLVIPFYAGKNLKQLIQEEGALDPKLAFHIFEQLLEGAQAIHEAKVVHRDLKPENVFLMAGQPPQVRIVDLGIARVMDDDLPEDQRQFRTLPGVISGSPAYIAPETATGDRIDGRTDIYSLGVILFQMLTGSLPLSAGTAYEFLREHLMGIPRTLGQAKGDVYWCEDLERLVASMLAKEKVDRPESCAAILAALRSGLRERTLTELHAPPSEEPADAPSNKPGLFNKFFKLFGD